MKHAWGRQVRALAAIGMAGAALFAVAAAPAFAHPLKPASPAAAGHLLRMPVRHGSKATLVPTVTVTGLLEKVDGAPYPSGAYVWWSTSDGQDNNWATPATVDASGAFTFTNVDAVTDGIIGVEYPDGSGLSFINQDFTAGSVVLQPGLIGVTIANVGVSCPIAMWGGGINLAAGTAAPSDALLAPPGVITAACVYLNSSQAVEWQGSATVAAGATSATSIDVDANNRHGVYTQGWASGAAGSKVSYVMEKWPLNYAAGIAGMSEFHGQAFHSYGQWTSPGAAKVTRTFIVPKTAPAGYPYEIHTLQVMSDPAAYDGLDVWDAFQVCSFRSSSWTIRRGQGIVLSGIVPTSTLANQGMHPGPRKSMFVLSRTTASGQPSLQNAPGWSKAAKVSSSTSGYFKTAVLHPRKTTWYVVWYPHDSWNWGAFTQVIKVTVR